MNASRFIDIHSHIVPGLDDGARDMDEALAIAEKAVENGVETIVATPHLAEGLYRPGEVEVSQGVEELREAVRVASLPLAIEAGAEVRISASILSWLEEDKVPTLGGGSFVLLELPFDIVPKPSGYIVSEMRARGLRTVLAHVERNLEIQRDATRLAAFSEMGCLIQINSNSLTGELGRGPKDAAIGLLKAGKVDIVASDSHNALRRYPNFNAAFAIVARIVGEPKATRMFRDTPRQVLATKRKPVVGRKSL